jgi:hypothetical protein
MDMDKHVLRLLLLLIVPVSISSIVSAQGRQPYPNGR